MFKAIQQCRLCGNKTLAPLLSLGEQVLAGVFPRVKGEKVAQGPLELVKCFSGNKGECCGLVQLRHSCDPSGLYGDHYGYRSGLNPAMVDHLHRKAGEIARFFPLSRGDLVVDIGSSDATLLNAYEMDNLLLVGVDPAGRKFKSYYPSRIQLISDFFSADTLISRFPGKRARVVTSVAMFYDLEAPLDFARQMFRILDDEGIWILEQSYLPTMLDRGSYDTICHEHLAYYALKQIKWIMDRSGFKIIGLETNDINGGSLSITAAKEGSCWRANKDLVERVLGEEERRGLDGLAVYARFRDRVYFYRERLSDLIRDINIQGKRIAGYGASTKGNVILQFCNLTAKELLFIVDVNPDKWGCFTPGTLIPIVSEAGTSVPDFYLVLPWSFRSNFLERERQFVKRGGKFIFPLPEVEVVN